MRHLQQTHVEDTRQRLENRERKYELFVASTDKSNKQWMWSEWTRYQFWMELNSQHPWMIFNFNDLSQLTIRTRPRNHKSQILHAFSICIVEFVSMSMSFIYRFRTIYFCSQSFWRYITWICSQSHGTSFGLYAFLMLHNMDNRIASLWIKFLTIGSL